MPPELAQWISPVVIVVLMIYLHRSTHPRMERCRRVLCGLSPWFLHPSISRSQYLRSPESLSSISSDAHTAAKKWTRRLIDEELYSQRKYCSSAATRMS